MLVELKDVEVHIEPSDILRQALDDGDINVDQVVCECIAQEDAESVLDAVDNVDITDYCKRYELGIVADNFSHIFESIKELNQMQKAQLLWLLLKCEEN